MSSFFFFLLCPKNDFKAAQLRFLKNSEDDSALNIVVKIIALAATWKYASTAPYNSFGD